MFVLSHLLFLGCCHRRSGTAGVGRAECLGVRLPLCEYAHRRDKHRLQVMDDDYDGYWDNCAVRVYFHYVYIRF